MGRDVTDFITSAFFLAGLGALAWWARRHEPHYVDADGSRFIARARLLDAGGGRPSRWSPVRGGVGTSSVALQPGLAGTRAIAGTYRVVSRIDDPGSRRTVFTLDGPRLVALRLPRTSPLVSRLEGMLLA